MKELTGENKEKSSVKSPENSKSADNSKWQKDFSAWCEKTAKQLNNITVKLDKHDLGE